MATYGPDAANVLFHVVNERHLRRRLIFLDGPSGRTRHLNLDETLPTKSERVRISGINGSEFPEPHILQSCAARDTKEDCREHATHLPERPRPPHRVLYCSRTHEGLHCSLSAKEPFFGSERESVTPSDFMRVSLLTATYTRGGELRAHRDS